MRSRNLMLFWGSTAALAMFAYGGSDGVTPQAGNGRKFVRTDPPPETNVAHGDFANGGGPSGEDTLHLNPEGGGGSSDWDKASDGQYYKRGGNGALSICFHSPPSAPDTYEYKMNQEYSSGGDVCPP